MAGNLFKTYYIPNSNGTNSSTVLTDSNTVFLHTYLGDDLTGDGTRTKPFKTYTKAYSVSGGSKHILFRGYISENCNLKTGNNIYVIGDDINQVIDSTKILPENWSKTILNCTVVNGIRSTYDYGGLAGGISMLPQTSFTTLIAQHCLLYGCTGLNFPHYSRLSNCTFRNYKPVTTTQGSTPQNIVSAQPNVNHLVWGSLWYNTDSNQFLVISSTTILKSNSGVNLVQPVYTSDSIGNVQIARNAFVAGGGDNIYVFGKSSTRSETCLVINESRTGGSAQNIFNKYKDNLTGTLNSSITANSSGTTLTITVSDSSLWPTSGDLWIPNATSYTNNGITLTGGSEVFTYTTTTINSPTSITLNGSNYKYKVAHTSGVTCTQYGDPIDYTLNPDYRNEALYAGFIGGYVGCFRPNAIINSGSTYSDWSSPINVNIDGTDDVVSGTLLLKSSDGNQFTFDKTSAQTWNRSRSQVITIPRHVKFKGANFNSVDGTSYGTYIGKKQTLISGTTINSGTTLTPGLIYKVFNDTGSTLNNSISYNNQSYIPGNSFVCVTGATSFTLNNSNSGTYLKVLLNTPMESVECIPYDDINTPSVNIPKFSCPLNKSVLILYHKTSTYGTINTPVLFNNSRVVALCGTKSPSNYYDSWVVSNADQEYYTLVSDTTNFYSLTPNVAFCKFEINAIYDSIYGS